MVRVETRRCQMNSTTPAPTVAPIRPAPWSMRYQPMACPRYVATNAPAIPLINVRVLSLNETYSEKVRAALTRREPRVR